MAAAGPDFTVVSAEDYYDQLLALIPKAQERIIITAMNLRVGPRMRAVLQAIEAAAKRGVRVHALGDIYSQHMAGRPDYLTRQGFKDECADTRQLLQAITAAGGKTTWVGKVGLNPYAGRYHAKMTVIDNDVFSFGGVNFTDDALRNIDYMLHTKHAVLATALEQLAADNANDLPSTDTQLALSPQYELLFDAGQRKTSLIYARACGLAAMAQRITYVSQMCPTGLLAARMRRATSVCYFNQPTKTGVRPDTLAQLWDGWRSGIKNHYDGNTYVHAKFILFEQKDGSKAVLSGSHNFSWRGVAFGTKEIALYSTDPVLWQRLQDIVYIVATNARTR